MVSTITKIPMSNNRELLVEVDEPRDPARSLVSAGPPRDLDFGAALGSIKEAAEELFTTLQSVSVKPDSCEIAFGVKITGSFGAILAKAQAEGNFSVKMTWSGLKHGVA